MVESTEKAKSLTSKSKTKEKTGNGKKSRGKPSTAAILVRMAESRCTFYKDEAKTPYAAIKLPNSDSIAVYEVLGEEFKALLSSWYYKATNGEKVPTASALNDAIAVLCQKAIETGETVDFSLRVAKFGKNIIYDPLNRDWTMIEILPGVGWQYKPHDVPVFVRYNNMHPQVEPDPYAVPEDFKRLLKFVNIKKDDEIIFLSHIASFIVPDIPHPALVFTGLQGAGKTSAFRAIKAVIDPGTPPSHNFTTCERTANLLFAQNYAIFFDNVSKISRNWSDRLCKVITGEGYSIRMLYRNHKLLNFTYRRCIALNGVDNPVSAPDLLDRSITYELRRIPKKQRKTEAEIMEEFKSDLPSIVGGLFATISKAMAIIDTVREELHELPRMADFTVWGEAIARALGYPDFDFYKAYVNKVKAQKTAVLDGDVLFHLITKLLIQEGAESGEDETEGAEIVGTPTEIFKELRKIAKEEDLLGGFPKNPDWLSRRLRRLRDNLREAGIEVKFSRENNIDRKRIIHIKQAKQATKREIRKERKPKKVSIKW